MTESKSADAATTLAAGELRLLDRLLGELTRSGSPVGTLELNRIYRALHSAPPLTPDGLRQVLRACIVKQREDADRFDELFERWVAANDAALRRWMQPESAEPEHGEPEEAPGSEARTGGADAAARRGAAGSRAPIDAVNEAGAAQQAQTRWLRRTYRTLAIAAVIAKVTMASAIYQQLTHTPVIHPLLPFIAHTVLRPGI